MGVRFNENSVALLCSFANFFSVWLRDSWMLMCASEMGLLSVHGCAASGKCQCVFLSE